KVERPLDSRLRWRRRNAPGISTRRDRYLRNLQLDCSQGADRRRFSTLRAKGTVVVGWLVQEARGISQSTVVRRVVGRAETDRRGLASVYYDCRRRRLRPAAA